MLGSTLPLRAEPPAAANGYAEAVNRAVVAYNAGLFPRAAEQFGVAHGLFANARTAKGLGMAEFQLGQFDTSAAHLQEALVSDVLPLDEPARDEAAQLLRRALERVARLSVVVRPEDAHLAIDGEHAALQPGRAAFLLPGAHRVELSAAGYETWHQQLRLRAGDEHTLQVVLHAQPEPARTETHPLRRNPWLWTTLSVLAAGGIAVGALALTGKFDRHPAADDGSANFTFTAPPGLR